jgi:hypothetical protein
MADAVWFGAGSDAVLFGFHAHPSVDLSICFVIPFCGVRESRVMFRNISLCVYINVKCTEHDNHIRS